MIPEYELWRFRTVLHNTGEVHGDPLLYVDVIPAQYLRQRFWNTITYFNIKKKMYQPATLKCTTWLITGVVLI